MFRILLFLIVFIHSTAFAIPPTMSLSEVQPGMKGYALTVVDPSNQIKSFDVEIIGKIENGKGSSPYIMAKASGALVNSTGGVLQGMSGSPVYVNGKLVGALSAGFKEMNPYIFLITPINSMLNIFDLTEPSPIFSAPKNNDTAETKKITDDNITDEIITEDIFDAEEINFDESDEIDTDDVEDKAYIFCSGFDSNSVSLLNKNLGLEFLSNVTSADELSIKYDSDLFPGSAFGAAIVHGDFTLGATGTVTVSDNKKVLGFGHPFTHLGKVNYFMTEANIIGAVDGTSGGGMKVATLGSIIGKITQDRESGVAGIIGNFPSVVPIQVNVNEKKYSAIMAYNESLIPQLGAVIAYSALNKTTDSVNEATVAVDFDIKTNIVDGGTLSRKNIFYSPQDVGQLAISELLNALTLISSNTTAESDIFEINVNMKYENGRRTASLVKAVCEKDLVKPGETVNLKILLQPYRRAAEEITVQYTIPITAKEGNFTLDLHGGGLIPITQIQTAGIIVPSTKSPAELYNEKIVNLLKTNRNNEIIIKPAAVTKTEKELKADIKRAKKLLKRLEKLGQKPPAAQPPAKVSTNYIIDNVIQCTLKVDKF